MEARTLTPQEVKKTFSSKKKRKAKVAIKNILVDANDQDLLVHLPEPIVASKNKLIEAFLNQFLPQFQRKRKTFKYEEIKNIPKEERKKARKIEGAVSMIGHLDVGINAVSRSVEKRRLSLVLVASDIDPIMMVSHVIKGCRTNHVPYAFYDKLRTLTKQNLGFSCIAIGIRNNEELAKRESFCSLCKYLEDFCHLKFKDKVTEDAQDVIMAPPKKAKVSSKPKTEIPNYHLKSKGLRRTFIPMPKTTPDIILLESDQESHQEVEVQSSAYKKLKIKQVQPNPKRKFKKQKTN